MTKVTVGPGYVHSALEHAWNGDSAAWRANRDVEHCFASTFGP